MAWDEQRRLRAAQADDTQIMHADTAAGRGHATPPPAEHAQAHGTPGWARWGQQFGWLVAVVLAVIALIFSVVAFANTGNSGPSGFARRAGHFAPYGGGAGGIGGGFAPNSGPTP